MFVLRDEEVSIFGLDDGHHVSEGGGVVDVVFGVGGGALALDDALQGVGGGDGLEVVLLLAEGEQGGEEVF